MSENGEVYTAGKNFTLPPAVTALTNSTSAPPHPTPPLIVVTTGIKPTSSSAVHFCQLCTVGAVARFIPVPTVQGLPAPPLGGGRAPERWVSLIFQIATEAGPPTARGHFYAAPGRWEPLQGGHGSISLEYQTYTSAYLFDTLVTGFPHPPSTGNALKLLAGSWNDYGTGLQLLGRIVGNECSKKPREMKKTMMQ